jgi:hypothetical protein
MTCMLSSQDLMLWPPPFPGDANYSVVVASYGAISTGPDAEINANALLMCGFGFLNISGTVRTFGCSTPTSAIYGGGGSNTNGDGSGAGHGGAGGNAGDGFLGGNAFGTFLHPTSSGSMGGSPNGGNGGGFAQVPWGVSKFGPIEKYYVCCELSVRKKHWRSRTRGA